MAKVAPDNKTCFVISPIGDDGSETRRRADQILKHIIAPAAKECGYEAIRADQINEAGIITSQVIQHIVEDSMVVADLTGRNPNVFYELAIRHAIRKPVVQLIQHNETIPFDVAATRTIKVDHRDLDSVASCRELLANQIRSAQADPASVDSPITVALNVQSLRESGDPLASSAAELISGMNEIKSMVAQSLASLNYGMSRGQDYDIIHIDELLHTAEVLRALARGSADKTDRSPELPDKLMHLVTRLEHLALRGDKRVRQALHGRVASMPAATQKKAADPGKE